MLSFIPGLLDTEKVTALRRIAEHGRFVDGRFSAGRALSDVKHNQELAAGDDDRKQINATILNSLFGNRQFRSVARPKRMTSPIISRYEQGMSYGSHTDAPMMGKGEPLRSDLSVTIFLSDPEGYGGGELSLQTPFGDKLVKLPAGDAVVYPTTMRHQVKQVTHGVRLVVVAWIQSFVKDPGQRDLLHEMEVLVERLATRDSRSEETLELKRLHSNLLRMWIEA